MSPVAEVLNEQTKFTLLRQVLDTGITHLVATVMFLLFSVRHSHVQHNRRTMYISTTVFYTNDTMMRTTQEKEAACLEDGMPSDQGQENTYTSPEVFTK